VRLLLDTHTFLWWIDGGRTLETEARAAIADGGSDVAVSAASAWEISIKLAFGKLRLDADVVDQLRRNRFRPLPITVEHALAAGALPRHHDDPFDRMLVAQALAEGLTIVTRDPRFEPYGVAVLAA
jgi:PIN domain nuclease of toxin-antitoxin system